MPGTATPTLRTCEAEQSYTDFDGSAASMTCGAPANVVVTLLALEGVPACLADDHTSDACTYGDGESIACRVGQAALCGDCTATDYPLDDYGVVEVYREPLIDGQTAYEIARSA